MSKNKKTFQNAWNYDHTKQYATVIDEPGMTQPDMTLTIPQMIKRFASGRPLNVKNYDDYGGDSENFTGIDLRTLDLHEVQELLETTRTNISRIDVEVKRRRKLAQDKALEDQIIEKYKARMKQEGDPLPGSPMFKQLALPIKEKPEN